MTIAYEIKLEQISKCFMNIKLTCRAIHLDRKQSRNLLFAVAKLAWIINFFTIILKI